MLAPLRDYRPLARRAASRLIVGARFICRCYCAAASRASMRRIRFRDGRDADDGSLDLRRLRALSAVRCARPAHFSFIFMSPPRALSRPWLLPMPTEVGSAKGRRHGQRAQHMRRVSLGALARFPFHCRQRHIVYVGAYCAISTIRHRRMYTLPLIFDDFRYAPLVIYYRFRRFR